MYWNNEIKMENLGYSQYHIDMKVSELGGDPWRLSCFYGEAQTNLRQRTWDTMKNLATLHNLPWACIGDFNEVMRHDEHDSIGTRNQTHMQGFRDAVDVCGLIDLGFQGRKWTFEKKVAGGSFTRVRLDRAFGSTE